MKFSLEVRGLGGHVNPHLSGYSRQADILPRAVSKAGHSHYLVYFVFRSNSDKNDTINPLKETREGRSYSAGI